MRDDLGIERPADLGQGDLEEVLLRVYPRKVTVLDRADTEDTIPAVRDFLAYLAESGGMTEAAVRKLERELDRIAPGSPTRRWNRRTGGRAFLRPGDGGQRRRHERRGGCSTTASPRTTPRWIRLTPSSTLGRNTRTTTRTSISRTPSGCRRAAADAAAAEAELPEWHAATRMFGQLRALAAWLGAGRAVTENAELAGGDAAGAAAALGLGPPDPPASGECGTFRVWITCGAWPSTRDSSNWTRTKPTRSRARSRRRGQTVTMTSAGHLGDAVRARHGHAGHRRVAGPPPVE